MMIAIDILNFLAGIAVVFLGYKLCHAWIMGKKFSELKPLTYSFAICLVLFGSINMRLLMDNILNFLPAIVTVFLGYKLCRARIMGKKFSELKPLLYSFAISLAIIWIINIFTGFIK